MVTRLVLIALLITPAPAMPLSCAETLALTAPGATGRERAEASRIFARALEEQGHLAEAALHYAQAGEMGKYRELRGLLEQALAHGDVVSVTPYDAPAGTTAIRKYRVRLRYRANGREYTVEAFFKPRQAPRGADNPATEEIAYQLSELFGLHVVPPTVLREIGGETGYLQSFLTDTAFDRDERRTPAVRIMTVLAGLSDDNVGNVLCYPPSGAQALIDFGPDVSFPEMRGMLNNPSYWMGKLYPPWSWETPIRHEDFPRIREVTPETLRSAPFWSRLTAGQQEELQWRVRWLQENLTSPPVVPAAVAQPRPIRR